MENNNIKTIEDLFIELAKLGMLVELTTGYADAINGYGWRLVFWIKIIKQEQICSKCERICKEQGIRKEYAANVKIHNSNCSWDMRETVVYKKDEIHFTEKLIEMVVRDVINPTRLNERQILPKYIPSADAPIR